jgi:hypothetical protein
MGAQRVHGEGNLSESTTPISYVTRSKALKALLTEVPLQRPEVAG